MSQKNTSYYYHKLTTIARVTFLPSRVFMTTRLPLYIYIYIYLAIDSYLTSVYFCISSLTALSCIYVLQSLWLINFMWFWLGGLINIFRVYTCDDGLPSLCINSNDDFSLVLHNPFYSTVTLYSLAFFIQLWCVRDNVALAYVPNTVHKPIMYQFGHMMCSAHRVCRPFVQGHITGFTCAKIVSGSQINISSVTRWSLAGNQ